MTDTVDVAIVGAGPYGLSLAAHLRSHGVDFRQFGRPLRAWSAAMPGGMFLKSQGFASNLSEPAGSDTLGAFCRSTGRGYGDYGVPVCALDLFVSTSAQEAFGMSVLEALSNGMPALYTACPALDGIHTERARAVGGDVDALRDEIGKEIAAGHRPREPVAAVVDRYGIESVAAQIDDLYERLLSRRRPAASGTERT